MKCAYCNNTIRKGTNLSHENYVRFPVKIYFCKKDCKEAFEKEIAEIDEKYIHLWSLIQTEEESFFVLDKMPLDSSPVSMINKYSFSIFSKNLTPPANPKFLELIQSALQKNKSECEEG